MKSLLMEEHRKCLLMNCMLDGIIINIKTQHNDVGGIITHMDKSTVHLVDGDGNEGHVMYENILCIERFVG